MKSLAAALAFAPENQWIAQGMNHRDVLTRPEVTRQLVDWLDRQAAVCVNTWLGPVLPVRE